MPALVVIGGASPDWMVEAGSGLADALPHGGLEILEGQSHVVEPDVLAPVVAGFLAHA